MHAIWWWRRKRARLVVPDWRHLLLRRLHRPRQCRCRNWVLIWCSINNISSNWGLDRISLGVFGTWLRIIIRDM